LFYLTEKSGDKVLGFVSIDLSPLLSGLQQISGWYNIVDTVGNVQGQLKISLIPQEDLFELKRFKYNSNQNQTKLDSHRSSSTFGSNVPPLIINNLSARSVSSKKIMEKKNIRSFFFYRVREVTQVQIHR
jgi:hypothetical protein